MNPKTPFLPLLGICFSLNSQAAPNSAPGTADYAYFDGAPGQQTVVVIGANLSKDSTKMNYCQTRTNSNGTTSGWHDAVAISLAEEDQYQFKAIDSSDSAPIVEARVMGADKNYTQPVVVGDGSHYLERFLTFRSPHDCLGTNIQVKWCRNPSPHLGSNICPNTKHALQCEKKNDFVVVGDHFAPGTVSQITISFDYTQIDVSNIGNVSDSVLKRAITSNTNCPGESSFREVKNLNRSCPPTALGCFSESDIATPGTNDVAVFYMFKRKSWPAVLNINNIQIETR